MLKYLMFFICYAKDKKNNIIESKYDPSLSAEDNNNYAQSINYDSSIPPVIVERILKTSFRPLFKYISSTFFAFIVEKYDNSIFFYSSKKLYKIDLNNKSIQSVNITIENPNFHGAIGISSQYVVLTFANRDIFIYDHNLNLLSKQINRYGIASKPIIIDDDKIYFSDVSDSLVEFVKKTEIKPKNKTYFERNRFFIPEHVGNTFNNCGDNILITEDYIIYGSSMSCVYILDKKTLNLKKKIPLRSNILYIKNKPILYNNVLILSSDNETIFFDMLTMKNIRVINHGSFAQHVIFKDLLILGDENHVYMYDLKNKELKNSIFIGTNNFILTTFVFNDRLFIFDSHGSIHLINHETSKFQKCVDNIKTQYTPLIKIENNKCYILVLNNYGELELYELKIIKEKKNESKI